MCRCYPEPAKRHMLTAAGEQNQPEELSWGSRKFEVLIKLLTCSKRENFETSAVCMLIILPACLCLCLCLCLCPVSVSVLFVSVSCSCDCLMSFHLCLMNPASLFCLLSVLSSVLLPTSSRSGPGVTDTGLQSCWVLYLLHWERL